MRHDFPRLTLAIVLASAAAISARAEQNPAAPGEEAAFLRSFEGRFSGTGRLKNAGGASHSLSCSFDGDQEGSRVTLTGRCSTALVLSTTVHIELRYDPRKRRYDGAFREGRGTVADLAGARQGGRLSLAFNETAESVRPNPPATLAISQRGGGLTLTLRGSQPGQGQNLDLTLTKS